MLGKSILTQPFYIWNLPAMETIKRLISNIRFKRDIEQIKENIVDKNLLLDLLKHDNIGVRSWAVAHMLGIKYEISKAEQEFHSLEMALTDSYWETSFF
jgi:hypothetical protein